MSPRQREPGREPEAVPEVYTPDYHLTPDAPVWAASHLHTDSGPWAVSLHAGLEVGVVLSGQEDIQLGDSLIRALPGDVWLCSMSEPHRYRVVAPGTRNLVVVFLPSFLGEEMLGDVPWLALFAAPPAERPRASPEMRGRLLGVAEDIEREVSPQGEGWQSMVRLDLLRLLLHLGREWKHGSGAAPGERSNLGRIMPALQLLQERVPTQITRREAADACGLGPSRFTMLFGESMGVSFTTFRRRTRLAFAANLLLTTDLPVEQVAERAGLSDASHLHHSFVREYGCTPGQYRKQAQMPRVERPDSSATRGRGPNVSRREGPAGR
jgi:AraC-like DNA-binding protein